MKYLVMECHIAYAVVLSDSGQFLKVANMHYEVGQTVTHVVEMTPPQTAAVPSKKANRRWMPALASMAACLVLVFGGFFMNRMPYASVYMAINPEVRIDVSRTDRVVGVTGVNADGLDLLEGYAPGSRDLDLVMDELVDRAIDMGYLHEGGKITLMLDANDKWVTDHEADLNDHLTQHLKDSISVTIDIVPQKPEQPHPNQNTSDGQSIVIPVGPESDYGSSDYGSGTEPGDSRYDDPQDSGFGVDGDSGYDDPQENPGSDEEAEENDSGYADSAYGSTVESTEPEDDDSTADADSPYDSTDTEPEQEDDSAYDLPDAESEESDEDSDEEK